MRKVFSLSHSKIFLLLFAFQLSVAFFFFFLVTQNCSVAAVLCLTVNNCTLWYNKCASFFPK